MELCFEHIIYLEYSEYALSLTHYFNLCNLPQLLFDIIVIEKKWTRDLTFSIEIIVRALSKSDERILFASLASNLGFKIVCSLRQRTIAI